MKKTPSYFEEVPDELKPQTSIPIGVLEWRVLAEFPDYDISTFGSVRRIHPGPNKKYHLVGNILKPYLVSGYPEVELSNEGKPKRVKVHILLAKTFIEREPKYGDVVRHLDHRPQIPTAWSVGWGSQEENRNDRNYHRLIHLLHNPSEEILNCGALLIDMAVNGMNGRDASKKWDIHYSKINKLKNAKRHALELNLLRRILDRVNTKGECQK